MKMGKCEKKEIQLDGNVSISTPTEAHPDDHVTWQKAVQKAYKCLRKGERQRAVFWYYHAGNKAAYPRLRRHFHEASELCALNEIGPSLVPYVKPEPTEVFPAKEMRKRLRGKDVFVRADWDGESSKIFDVKNIIPSDDDKGREVMALMHGQDSADVPLGSTCRLVPKTVYMLEWDGRVIERTLPNP